MRNEYFFTRFLLYLVIEHASKEKDQKEKKSTSSANPRRKPAVKPKTQGSTAKSPKPQISAGPTTVAEPTSSRATKIVAKATKVALSTRSRARRWLQKAGEYLSKKKENT